MATANRAGKIWHAVRSGSEIELIELGVYHTESEARTACPDGSRLLLRDEIRDLATGRLVFEDIAPLHRLQLAFECSKVLGLKAQSETWSAAIEVFAGRADRTGRVDESSRTDAELAEIASRCRESLSPELLRVLSPDQLHLVGARFALSQGLALSEREKVGTQLCEIVSKEVNNP